MRSQLQSFAHTVIDFVRTNGRWSVIRKNPVALFVIISLVFGLVLALRTPLLWGGDETTHYARAFQISQGNAVSDRLPYPWGDYSYGGEIPLSVHNLIMHVNDDITSDTRATPYGTKRINDPASYGPLAKQQLGSEMHEYLFPNSAPYSPIAYIPSALALRVATIFDVNVGQSIYMARIACLLFFIACVAYGMWSLRGQRIAWLVMAVALVPMVLFQSSIISGDAVANAFALLFVALIAKALLAKQLTRLDSSLLLAMAVAIPLVKPTYVFISLALLIVPHKVIGAYGRVSSKLVKFGALGLMLVLLAVWTFITREVSDAIRLIGTGPRWTLISIEHQIEFLLHNPLQGIIVFFRSLLLQDNNYFNGLFGQLGFIFVQVPAASIVTSTLAAVIAIGMSERIVIPLKRVVWGVLCVLGGVGAIFLTFYLTFSNVGQAVIEGVQGRYFLPFVGLALLIVAIATYRVRFDLGKKDERAIGLGVTVAALSVVSLTFATTKFFYVLLG